MRCLMSKQVTEEDAMKMLLAAVHVALESHGDDEFEAADVDLNLPWQGVKCK